MAMRVKAAVCWVVIRRMEKAGSCDTSARIYTILYRIASQLPVILGKFCSSEHLRC